MVTFGCFNQEGDILSANVHTYISNRHSCTSANYDMKINSLTVDSKIPDSAYRQFKRAFICVAYNIQNEGAEYPRNFNIVWG